MALNFPAAPTAPILGTPTFDTDAGAFLSWMATTTGIIASVSGYLRGDPTIYSVAGSGTYNVPTGAVALLVEMVGGGGGGGGAGTAGAVAHAASGAGAGTYVRGLLLSPLPIYTYTVGAAGAGSAAANTDGSAGGNTSFGTAIAPPGNGGIAGGTATNTNYIIPSPAHSNAHTAGPLTSVVAFQGEVGGAGLKFDPSRIGGAGGSGPFGAGGRPVSLNATGSAIDGNSATGAGAGGSGGISYSGAAAAGGNGSPGLIIITPLY